ncbi:MAG: glucosaminidase domain-containing protein [Fusobacterium sp. JB021]|nr:glucosaminidase domain-containing protein [Fusobacterium sp. JB021]MDP0507095.1 glucosaminidase domain-containing protein [Fusobacterium sp. JB019]
MKEINKFLFSFIFVSLLFIQEEKCMGSFFKKESIITDIKYEKIEVNKLEDIYSEREGDFVFSELNIDLRKLSVVKRKEAFIRLMLPSIKVVHKEILNNKRIVSILKSRENYTLEEEEYLKRIFKKYKVKYKDFKTLESKMVIYPTSLILAQGGLESAWGTSRFFREGNNAFGIWSSNKTEPRIAAKSSRKTFTAHLRSYGTLKETVEDICMLISRAEAYKKVRDYINEGENSYKIAEGLIRYSEEGRVYVKKIKGTLKYNHLEKYDK